jgi:spore coat protein CotH
VAVALLALTIGGLGAWRVRPLVLARGGGAEATITDIAGTVALFDTTVRHELTLIFADDAYDRMIAAYHASDDKSYVEADLTVDGTLLPSVGIRLKGNSTLRSLGGGPAGPGGGNFGRGMTGTTLSFDSPEELPWLVSLDHFVKNRRYQGRENLALRPAGQTGSTLNEAVALQLVGLAGEPTQRSTYVSLSVNDRPVTTRLLIEVPDKPYADGLGTGVLYKSLATGSFTDQGDEITAYADDFDQVNRKGSQDLEPVIEFIRWVNTASDAEFNAQLADHLDVESFSRYVALQNLLLNFDDMAGPGRNYYLYYDLDTKRFQVVTWDLNLALSGNASQGPFDASTMVGGGAPGGFRSWPGWPAPRWPSYPTVAFPRCARTRASPTSAGRPHDGRAPPQGAVPRLDRVQGDVPERLPRAVPEDCSRRAPPSGQWTTRRRRPSGPGATVDASQVTTLRTTLSDRKAALAANADVAG